jgi:hypothetical protein
VSISPQSHCAKADASSFANNCNVPLLRKGCAHVATCCSVRHSWRRWLLRSCGSSDGPTDFVNNCNVSLLREGCARAVAYCMVCRSWHKWLLRFYGILDGSTDSVNNCNKSLSREGCAHVVACCTVRRSRHKRLLRSYGVSDGLAYSIRCLARHSLCRWLRRSCAAFNVSWLNFAGALICGTWFSKELVCWSFC